MPIRFRCAYCNQLMAIATRKAGTVVRCPKCAGEVIVPAPPEGSPPEPDDGRGEATAPNDINEALEDGEFDKYFEPAGGEHSAQTATTPAPPPPKPQRAPAPLPEQSLTRPGLFVPLWAVGVGVVVALLLLAVAFAIGFQAGRGG